MAAVSAPYATGTIDSIAGTTVNISGGAVAGWVGRGIRIADGPAMGQIRKIVTVVSATQITVEFAWNISPFAAFGFTEVEPVNGNTFRISHGFADIVDGTTIIADAGTLSYRFVGASTFSGGAFLYATNARIELTSSSIAAGSPTTDLDRCCFRFGDVDQFGNVYNGCFLTDAAAAPSGFGTGSAATRDPDFHFYAGMIRFTGAAPFWRFHSDANETVRIVGVNVDGNMGGRIIGSKTILKDWIVYNMQSASGPFNPKSPIGLITNIVPAKSLQSIYQYWPDSLTVSAEGIKPDTSVTKLVRFANTNRTGETFTVIDFTLSTLQGMAYLYTNSNGTYSNTFRLSQYLQASYVSAAGSAITDPTRFVVRDNVPTNVYDASVTTGSIPKQTLRYRDMTILNTGDYTWASAGGTTFAPYAIAAVSYLYQPASLPLPLATSQNVSLVALVDSYISQTNRATVDGYTEIDTLDKFYDRAKTWTIDNLSAANPSFGAQLVNGNGTELNLGAFNLVVNNSAASPFAVSGNTITIKALVLSPGSKFVTLRTTGSLTLLNGSTMGISYTTGAGSFASISVSGLVTGSRIQLYNLTDAVELYNDVVAGTSFSQVFSWPGIRSVRLRASIEGYMDYEQSGQFLSSGLSFTASTPTDPIYVKYGIDGGTVTELTPDFPNVQVDINDPDGILSIRRFYAWYHHVCETADGIRNFFGSILAEDEFNLKVITAKANLKFDNVGASAVKIIDGRIYRDDGTSIIGAGAIEMDPGKAYTAGLGAIEAMIAELYAMQGLKAGAPMTVTPTSRTADGVSLVISGDGVTSTTVTRS